MHTEQEKDIRDQDILDIMSKTLKKSHFWTNAAVMVKIHADRVFSTNVINKISSCSTLFLRKNGVGREKFRRK